MKTIHLTHPSPELADLFEQARNDDLIVKLAGLMALLEARASQTRTVPLDEVRRQLKL